MADGQTHLLNVIFAQGSRLLSVGPHECRNTSKTVAFGSRHQRVIINAVGLKVINLLPYLSPTLNVSLATPAKWKPRGLSTARQWCRFCWNTLMAAPAAAARLCDCTLCTNAMSRVKSLTRGSHVG